MWHVAIALVPVPVYCEHGQDYISRACVVQILMFPSKSDGMFVPESLIFRSDSNGEDLEGYAGAGLYDSITMDTTELKKVDYNGDRCASLPAAKLGFTLHCITLHG